MPIDIQNAPIQNISTSSMGAQGASQVRFQGVYNGEAMFVMDPTSFLEGLEELTFAADDLAELATQRGEKKDKKAEVGAHDRLSKMMQMRGMLTQVPDFDPDVLDEIQAYLLEQTPENAEEMLNTLSQKFGMDDPTHQFLALTMLKETVPQNLLPLLDEALAMLMKQSGPEVNAGLNVSLIAAQFAAQNPNVIQQLRQFYRKRILGFTNFADAYESILSEYGMEDFDKSLQFLLKGMGADMSATTPSTSKGELEEIQNGIYQLEVMNTIHGNASLLLSRQGKRYVDPRRKSVEELMTDVLTLIKEKWANLKLLQDMCLHYGSQEELTAQIYFLTGLLDQIIKMVPIKVFENMDIRNNLIDTTQQVLDEKISQEEDIEDE